MKTSATTPRRTSRSPRAVNARSICARSRRTLPGSVTLLPGLRLRGRRRVSGTLLAPGPERRRAGPEARPGTTADAEPATRSRPAARDRVWPRDARPGPPAGNLTARHRGEAAHPSADGAAHHRAPTGTPPGTPRPA